MRSGRGKVVAFTTMAVALTVVVAFGIVFRHAAVEACLEHKEIQALRFLGPRTPELHPAIVEFALAEHSETICECLRESGIEDPTPFLEALNADDPGRRQNAARGLGCLGRGDEAIVRALAALLEDPDEHGGVRLAAVLALEMLGAKARAAEPALRAARRDGIPEVRGQTRSALMKLRAGR